MTPPARPDPVAALASAMATSGYADPDPVEQWRLPDAGPVAARLAESGYVLVSADMLAEALAAEVDAVFGPPADGISIANRRGIVAGTMERLAALTSRASSEGGQE